MIWSYYKLSKATYCRLKNSDNETHQITSSNQAYSMEKDLSAEAKLLVSKLVEPPKLPLTVKDLQLKLFEILHKDYNDSVIRRFLKNNLKYSFK